jgi:hypothetical protein
MDVYWNDLICKYLFVRHNYFLHFQANSQTVNSSLVVL